MAGGIKITAKETVWAIIENTKTGKIRRYKTSNLVTTEGDKAYAYKVCGQKTDFDDNPALRLGTSSDDPSKDDSDVHEYIDSSANAIDDGYPVADSSDENNPDRGENVVTWKISYDKGAIVTDHLRECAIVDDGSNPSKALNRFVWDDDIQVTADDTLTVYVNHEFKGS